MDDRDTVSAAHSDSLSGDMTPGSFMEIGPRIEISDKNGVKILRKFVALKLHHAFN